jgi:hypothetical protein
MKAPKFPTPEEAAAATNAHPPPMDATDESLNPFNVKKK